MAGVQKNLNVSSETQVTVILSETKCSEEPGSPLGGRSHRR